MQAKKKAFQILIFGLTILIGSVLCGIGKDLDINTIFYPGTAFCVFGGIYLVICIFEWMD